MEIKRVLQHISLTIVSIFLFFFVGVQATHAAGGVLRASPAAGNYHTGDTFTIQIIVDGGGQAFNAAKAIVVVSPALRVKAVTLGDCNFAFVKTPTNTDPSFTGAILGSSATSCTLYTITAEAVNNGVGSIVFISGSIKAYKGATELFSNAQNASYSISGNSIQTPVVSPTQPPTYTQQGVKLYTLLATIDTPSNIPDRAIRVVLDLNSPTQREILGSSATFTNPVIFDRVPEGVHTIEVFTDNKFFSKQVLNVGGPSQTLVFGMSAQSGSTPWYWYVIMVGVICVVGGLSFFLYRYFFKKQQGMNANQPVV